MAVTITRRADTFVGTTVSADTLCAGTLSSTMTVNTTGICASVASAFVIPFVAGGQTYYLLATKTTAAT